MDKILITGSAGFIGMHLCESLLKDGHEVLGIDSINNYYEKSLKEARLSILSKYNNFSFSKQDISIQKDISKIFSKFKPEKVINLAGQAGVRYSLQNPNAYIKANINGFMNILECSRINDVQRLVYASSSSVYGGNKKIPFGVHDQTDDPISIYAVTKKTNEQMAKAYSHLHKLCTIGLRFFTVYGPWGRPDMAMYIFTQKILEGKPVHLFNHGNMFRDYTYIDDIVDGIKSALSANYFCDVFNLGNSKSEGLSDIIKLIEASLGKKAHIEYSDIQPGEVVRTCADINYSKEKLNYEPKVSINEGIPKFVDWFMSYYSKEL